MLNACREMSLISGFLSSGVGLIQLVTISSVNGALQTRFKVGDLSRSLTSMCLMLTILHNQHDEY